MSAAATEILSKAPPDVAAALPTKSCLAMLPELLALITQIQTCLQKYQDLSYVKLLARSGVYKESFEEFDSELQFWVSGVTMEVLIRSVQIGAATNAEIRRLTELVLSAEKKREESDKALRRQFVKDTGRYAQRIMYLDHDAPSNLSHVG